MDGWMFVFHRIPIIITILLVSICAATRLRLHEALVDISFLFGEAQVCTYVFVYSVEHLHKGQAYPFSFSLVSVEHLHKGQAYPFSFSLVSVEPLCKGQKLRN